MGEILAPDPLPWEEQYAFIGNESHSENISGRGRPG